MEAGAINIKFLADILDLQSKMKTAQESVAGTMQGIESAIGFAKKALVAFTGIASVESFIGMIEGSIKSAASLEALAMQAGMSGEALSGLVQVGKLSGTSAEDIAGTVNKLQRAMAGSADDTKKAGLALAAIGINFSAFKDLGPDEQMVAVGQAMNNFADGTGKSQVAMDLFGKTGAQYLEYLRDLGLTQHLNAKFTDEQIAQADMLDKEMIKLKASGQGWKSELAMGMLPALQETAEATLAMVNGTGGLREEVKRLSADGSIADWTRNAITGATYVLDAFSGLKAVIITVGQSMGYMAASAVTQFGGISEIISKVIKGDWSGAMDTMRTATAAQEQMTQDFHATLDKTWGEQTLGQQLRARIAEVQAHGVATDIATDQVKHAAAAQSDLVAAMKKADEAGKSLIASINLKNQQLQQELDLGRKLTDGEKELMKLRDDVASGVATMTLRQYENAKAKSEQNSQLQLHINLQASEKKLQDDIQADAAKIQETLEKRTETMGLENEKIRDQLIAQAAGKEAMQQLTIARLLDQAAIDDSMAKSTMLNGIETDVSKEWVRQAALLRERAGLLQDGIVVKEAQEAQRAWEHTTKAIGDGLSSALTDALFQGRSLWDAFRKYLIDTILDGAIKNALSSVIQGGLNSMFGGSSPFGSAATGAAGSAAGGAATGGGLLSGLGGALSGSTSIPNALGTVASNLGYGGGGIDGLLATNGAYGTAAPAAAPVGTIAGEGAGLGANLTGLGVAALFALGYSALSGPAKPYQVMGTGDLPELADRYVGTITANQNGSQASLLHDVSWQQNYFPNDKSTWYEIFGDGVPMGAVQSLSDVASLFPDTSQSINNATPHFATGGDFGGGVRIVGENGPEFEVTGPSRIFNASETASMLRSGGASNDEVIAELKLMHGSLQRVIENTSETARALNGRQRAPFLVEMTS